MAQLRYVLEEQIERNEKNIAIYMSRLEKLPKGTIHQRKRSDKVYYYLKFRDDTGKRVDRYLKEAQVNEVRRQLGKRKEYLLMIKGLKEDIKIARKGLNNSVWR